MGNTIILSLLFVLLSVIFWPKSVLELCDLGTCPFCFGKNMCGDIEENQVTLQFNTVLDLFYNCFSVKNVYFAQYKDKKVVLKKLAHNSELSELKLLDNVVLKDVIELLVRDTTVKHFSICDEQSVEIFVKNLRYEDIRNIYTLIQINVEPILLEIFSFENWPVPMLYGYCGRIAVIENSGEPLYKVENLTWFQRAYLALQILQAAKKFTDSHDTFRLYLTDISPDNIVVNQDLKISFIDLENAILKIKNSSGLNHYSKHFNGDSYIYSRQEVCESSISDHNMYAVCRLLLSKHSPWPMMQNGLLHSPTKIIKQMYSDLFKNIEDCVYTNDNINRFDLSDKILNGLKSIVTENTDYLDSV